jgi:hypothetical protein
MSLHPESLARQKRRPFWGAPLLVAAALALFGSPALAEPSSVPPELGYDYGEVETPRAAGVAGAIRATSIGTSAMLANPANMAVGKVYHVGALAQLYPESGRMTFGGAVVDSIISSSGLAGGFYGGWSQQDPDGIRREWTDLRFGLAMPLADILYLGITGRYLNASQKGLGPLGQSKASGGIPEGSIIETVTFEAGATLRPLPEFLISVVGYNLTNQDTSLLPLMGALAVGFTSEDFSLGADMVLESRTYGDSRIRVQGGGELLIADVVPVRLGYRFDQGPESHALAAGVGYLNQKFGIDVAVRRAVVGPEYTAVTFGFTLHIEAMGLSPN